MTAILAVRRHWLGDVLMAVAALRQFWLATGVRSDLVVDERFTDAVADQSCLRQVIAVAPGQPASTVAAQLDTGYHAAINLHVSDPDGFGRDIVTAARTPLRGGFHAGDTDHLDIAVPLGRQHGESVLAEFSRLIATVTRIPLPVDAVLDSAQPAGKRSGIVLAPGARRGFRQWPTDSYITLARQLHGSAKPVTVLGHVTERRVVEAVAASVDGVETVVSADTRELATRLRGCAVAVANNSGLAHLAASTGTPVVVVNSHVDAVVWRPGGVTASLVADDAARCSCRLSVETEQPERAELQAFPCGAEIGVDQVHSALDTLLSHARA